MTDFPSKSTFVSASPLNQHAGAMRTPGRDALSTHSSSPSLYNPSSRASYPLSKTTNSDSPLSSLQIMNSLGRLVKPKNDPPSTTSPSSSSPSSVATTTPSSRTTPSVATSNTNHMNSSNISSNNVNSRNLSPAALALSRRLGIPRYSPADYPREPLSPVSPFPKAPSPQPTSIFNQATPTARSSTMGPGIGSGASMDVAAYLASSPTASSVLASASPALVARLAEVTAWRKMSLDAGKSTIATTASTTVTAITTTTTATTTTNNNSNNNSNVKSSSNNNTNSNNSNNINNNSNNSINSNNNNSNSSKTSTFSSSSPPSTNNKSWASSTSPPNVLDLSSRPFQRPNANNLVTSTILPSFSTANHTPGSVQLKLQDSSSNDSDSDRNDDDDDDNALHNSSRNYLPSGPVVHATIHPAPPIMGEEGPAVAAERMAFVRRLEELERQMVELKTDREEALEEAEEALVKEAKALADSRALAEHRRQLLDVQNNLKSQLLDKERLLAAQEAEIGELVMTVQQLQQRGDLSKQLEIEKASLEHTVALLNQEKLSLENKMKSLLLKENSSTASQPSPPTSIETSARFHGNSIDVLNRFEESYRQQGLRHVSFSIDDVQRQFKEALKIEKRQCSDDHPTGGLDYHYISSVLLQISSLLYESAVRMKTKAFPISHSEMLRDPLISSIKYVDSSSSCVNVCADVGRNIVGLRTVFDINGWPSADNPYVFNGILLESASFPVLITIFALRCLYPDSVCVVQTDPRHQAKTPESITSAANDGHLCFSWFQHARQVFSLFPVGVALSPSVVLFHCSSLNSPLENTALANALIPSKAATSASEDEESMFSRQLRGLEAVYDISTACVRVSQGSVVFFTNPRFKLFQEMSQFPCVPP